MGKASRHLQTTATALVEVTILTTPSEYLPELLEPLYKVSFIGTMGVWSFVSLFEYAGRYSYSIIFVHLSRHE